MVYYAGHGVQVEGENYCFRSIQKFVAVRFDGISLTGRPDGHAGPLEPDAYRRARRLPQQFVPEVSDAGRGLAMVDSPNGSIVGYSTAPGMEAQDSNHNRQPS